MSSVAGRGARRRRPALARASRTRNVTPGELAWIAVVPCTLLALLAVVVLGPPLGHTLFPRGSDALWPPGWWETEGHAEPVKQGRFALAVLAALLVPAAVLAASRWEPRLRPRTIRAVTLATQALLVPFAGVALVKQDYLVGPGLLAPRAFGVGAIAAATALLGGAVLLLRQRGPAARIAQLSRETPMRRYAGLAIAVAFSAIWLLKVLKTDRVPGDVPGWNLPWTLNDAFAVLNGRTPLVDYHVLYAQLLPYPAALALSVLGATTLVYSGLLALLDGLALLAVYAVYRSVTRSSLLAVGLFLPFVATSDLNTWRVEGMPVSPMTLPAMWPMRYGGAYLLAWLAARHVSGRGPRHAWILFLVGGLVAIDNMEFGIAALVATAAALLCARPPRSSRAVLGLAVEVLAGALGAVMLVALFTFVRAGALPSPALLFEWPGIFTNLGWFSLPLHVLGFHLAIYATFAAAIATAAVRVSRSDDDALLTGMLAWSGTFGLLAGGYFIGRPDAFKLEGMLSAWSFALGLLVVVCVRALAAQSWRRPTVAQLVVLFGFALSICSIARLSPPQAQIARLTDARHAPTYRATAERFVRERTRPHETVAILLPMSYRIAYDLGLRNVAPYAFMNAIVTRSQLQTLIDAVRRAHVREIFTPAPGSELAGEGDAAPDQLAALAAAGYRRRSTSAHMVELRSVR